MRVRLAFTLVLLGAVVGCGSSGTDGLTEGPVNDGTTDAGDAQADANTDADAAAPDGSQADAQLDAAADVTSDTTADVTSDTAADASDAPPDAGPDAPVDAGPAAAQVSATSLDFGDAPCGGAAPASQAVVVTNVGGAPLSVAASLTPGAPFTIEGNAVRTIAAGAAETFTVDASAVPAAATAGTAIAATLTLATSDSAHPTVQVPLTVNPVGATLVLTESTTDFGDVPFGSTSASRAITLTNTGNRAATVTVGTPSDAAFAVAWTGAPAPIAIAPGDAAAGLAATFTPATLVAATASAPLTVQGAVCGASVTALSLAGRGTAGVATVSGDLDFGAVSCGTAAAAKQVTITNTGNVDFHFTAALGAGSGSAFAIDKTMGTVPAMGLVSVNATPAPIPATSLVPGAYSDALTITTDFAKDAPHVVALTEAASGVVLAFDDGSIPFGQVPVASHQTASFTLRSTGDRGATVTLSTVDGAFAVTPSAATAIPASGVLAGNVTFSPSNNQAHADTLVVTVPTGTVLCQPLPTVALSGTGTNGAVSIDHSSLSFTDANGLDPACGGTALPQKLTVKNTGNAPFDWTASLGKTPSPFQLAPQSGTLAAGASIEVSVTPLGVPAVSSTATDGLGDAVTIATNVIGDAAHVIPLHQTARGAVLSFGGGAVAFGSVPLGTSPTAPVQIVNAGNATAAVSLVADPSVFHVSPGGPSALAGGATLGATARFSPTAVGDASGTISLSVGASDPLCAPLPAPLAIGGTGTNGQVALSPSSIDFGAVNCGATAAAQAVTFTNPGSAAYTITGATLGLGASSPYSVAIVPSDGVVPPGGSATVTVTPSKIPQASPVPGSYGDTLTVTTNAAGDTPHAIAISETAQGAILGLTAKTVKFNATPVGGQSTYQLGVFNTGNLPATVSWSPITSPVFTFDQAQVVGAGVSDNVNAYFAPTAAQGYSGSATLTVAQGTVLCQTQLPGPVALTGTGTNGSVYTVSPQTLSFGQVDCGKAAAPQYVTLSNASGSPVAFTASLGTSYYQLDATSGTVPANGTVKIEVTPVAIPVSNGTSIAYDAFGDTLTITGAGQSYGVQLIESAQGAILAFEPAALTVKRIGTRSATFKVRDAGNLAADVTLTASVGTTGFTVTPTTGSARPVAPLSGTVSLTTGAAAGAGTVSVSSTSVLCAPLPSPLAVTVQ